MKNLYLFTVKYPFTKYAECFLEDEIIYLSKKFDHIQITPLEREGVEVKPMPSNCSASTPLFLNKKKFVIRGLFNWQVTKKMIPLLFKHNTIIDKVRRQDWLKAYFTANNLLNSAEVKEIAKKLSKDDVCYFYWGKWSNVMAYFWQGRCHMVSRFHGEGDLWEECHKGFVPLRAEVVKSLDAAAFISKKGEKYFKERYPECKTRVFPLGSNDIDYCKRTPSGKIRVLSCSTVSALKRVTLIYESLLAVKGREIEWTHIGGGPMMGKLEQMVSEHQGSHVDVKLLGAKNHDEVMDYYTKHCFDVFINLSTNEGVPVSIMEAISCDIPVVATNVGGNSEIVTEETGLLVSADPTPNEVAAAISKVIHNSFEPRLFWEKHYDAAKNYDAFADFISEL